MRREVERLGERAQRSRAARSFVRDWSSLGQVAHFNFELLMWLFVFADVGQRLLLVESRFNTCLC